MALFPRFQEANDSAANALLKTLEEAPSYAVLILTADNLEQLLPTIVSRCEVLRLRPVPLEKVEPFVERRIQQARAAGIDVQPALEAGARLIAHISGGRPGYAVRLIEDPSGLAFRSEKLGDLQALLSSTRVRKFSYAEKLAVGQGQLQERAVAMVIVLARRVAARRRRFHAACQHRPFAGNRLTGKRIFHFPKRGASYRTWSWLSSAWKPTSIRACWPKPCCSIGRRYRVNPIRLRRVQF